MRIMIVDDDKPTLEVLVECCEVLGHQTVGCKNGSEALEKLEIFKPDMVITDYNLDQTMNGAELTRLIKEKSPYCNIVVMSGYGSVKLAVSSMKAGAFEFLQKPVDFSETERIVNESKRRSDEIPSLEEVEKRHVEGVINISSTLEKAAKKLNIDTSTLWRKRKHNIAA